MKIMSGSAAALISALSLPGCGLTPGVGSGDYSRAQTRGEQSVRYGFVDGVRQVRIEGTRSGVGPVAGAVTGGVAGSNVGGGRGQILGAVLGAVAGGVAGQAIESGTTRKQGVEVTVALESGKVIAVTQEDDGEKFSVGERVKVLSGGGTTRVTH